MLPPGEAGVHRAVRRALLICGILSSLLYVVMNAIAPLLYPGYSCADQTVSELSAIGVPSREFWVPLGLLYTFLVATFGLGVWQTAVGNRRLRITGGLLIVYGLTGLGWPPMHQREVLAAGGGTLTDTMHLVFAAVTVSFMFSIIGFGAGTSGRKFRVYSVVSIIVLLLFGALTGLHGADVGKNLPTPWIGVWERVNIGVYMLWVIVFAVRLLRRRI